MNFLSCNGLHNRKILKWEFIWYTVGTYGMHEALCVCVCVCDVRSRALEMQQYRGAGGSVTQNVEGDCSLESYQCKPGANLLLVQITPPSAPLGKYRCKMHQEIACLHHHLKHIF